MSYTIKTQPFVLSGGAPFKVAKVELVVDKEASGSCQYTDEDLTEFMPASSFDLTNKRERGYLVPGMAIGLVLLSLGCAALWRVAGHEREQRAVAEANARQWQATALECSVATEKAAKAGQEAARKAQAALLAARKGVATTQAEIARLRASQAASCQAAVAEVRKGLK